MTSAFDTIVATPQNSPTPASNSLTNLTNGIHPRQHNITKRPHQSRDNDASNCNHPNAHHHHDEASLLVNARRNSSSSVPRSYARIPPGTVSLPSDPPIQLIALLPRTSNPQIYSPCFTFFSYTQETPYRFKKEVVAAAKGSDDQIVIESMQRVLHNIGASQKFTTSDLEILFDEMGESGSIPADRMVKLL